MQLQSPSNLRDADLDSVVKLGELVARELADTECEADAAYDPSCRVTAVGKDDVTCQTLIGIRHFKRRGSVIDEYLRMLERALKTEGVAAPGE